MIGSIGPLFVDLVTQVKIIIDLFGDDTNRLRFQLKNNGESIISHFLFPFFELVVRIDQQFQLFEVSFHYLFIF